MAYNEQDLIPIEQIKKELLLLCTAGKTGDLCLFTEKKHAAVISLYEGDIVGLRYRISRGNDALKFIKDISKAKIRFQKGANAAQPASVQLPPTIDILHILDVEFDNSALHKIGKKVLVVEDSRTQRKFICRMLMDNGYDAQQAADGYEALELLKTETPDLILLDIIMPGIDGYKVMDEIKVMPGMKDIPIIMLTSRDSLIDKVRGRVSGTDEYLTKPFKSEELMQKVDKYLHSDNENIVRSAHA